MEAGTRLAYNLLNDLNILENNSVLETKEISYLLSSKLSHKYSKSMLGRLYLRHYYTPMIVTALKQLEKGSFLEIGCGTGTQVILAELMGFETMLGIDMIPERIKIAQKRASFYNMKTCNFKVADFWNIYMEKPVNAVYSMFSFELFGSPPLNACQRLADFCSKKCRIILDMGRVKQYNRNYFIDIINGLKRKSFDVRIEPLIPFLVDTTLTKVIGRCHLWPHFRAVRIIATRQ